MFGIITLQHRLCKVLKTSAQYCSSKAENYLSLFFSVVSVSVQIKASVASLQPSSLLQIQTESSFMSTARLPRRLISSATL